MNSAERATRGELIKEKEQLLANACEYWIYHRNLGQNFDDEGLARNRVIDAAIAVVKADAEFYAAKHGALLGLLSEGKAINTLLNALVVPGTGRSVDKDGLVAGLASIVSRTGAYGLDDVQDGWGGEYPENCGGTADTPLEGKTQQEWPSGVQAGIGSSVIIQPDDAMDPFQGPKFTAGAPLYPYLGEDDLYGTATPVVTAEKNRPALTLWLPDAQVGAVVGYKGAGLKDISRYCGVKLHLSKQDVSYNPHLEIKERKLTLTGTSETSYQQAIDYVREFVTYVREGSLTPQFSNTIPRDADTIPEDTSPERKKRQLYDDEVALMPCRVTPPIQDVAWLDGSTWREDDAGYRIEMMKDGPLKFLVHKTLYGKPRFKIELFADVRSTSSSSNGSNKQDIMLWFGDDGKWRCLLNPDRLEWRTHSGGRVANLWIREQVQARKESIGTLDL